MNNPARSIALGLAAGGFIFTIVERGFSWFHIAHILVAGSALGLNIAARRSPSARWVGFVFGPLAGPRTDVERMTRSELFRAAASFNTWFLGGCSVTLLILAGAGKNGIEQAPVVFGVGWVAAVLTAMAGAGAVYVLLRALFRSRDYVPPRHLDE